MQNRQLLMIISSNVGTKKDLFSIFYISDLLDSPIFVFAIHPLTPFILLNINHPYLVQLVELFRQPVPT